MAIYVTRPRRDEVRIGRGLPSDTSTCISEDIWGFLFCFVSYFCFCLCFCFWVFGGLFQGVFSDFFCSFYFGQHWYRWKGIMVDTQLFWFVDTLTHPFRFHSNGLYWRTVSCVSVSLKPLSSSVLIECVSVFFLRLIG